MARQWQTIVVSVALHVCAVFFLVVIPLLAMDGLPALRSATEYVPVEMKMPAMPPAPRPASSAAPRAADPVGPPVEAPVTIEAERPAAVPALGPVVPGAVGDVLAATAATGPVTTVAPPPLPPAAAEPVRPGGNVKPPLRSVYVPPVYPPTAIAARVDGSVIIEAIIGTDGHVRDAKVLRSIPLLDAAALAAVRQWRYSPTTLNGVPVSVIMTVTVTFVLTR